MERKIFRICVIGPECTGKTTLSKALAAHFREPWVPEFARQYLDNLGRPYQQDDLLTIARGQILEEETLNSKANRMLVCDTNLLVIKVWSEHKYGYCDAEIQALHTARTYDHYLLTATDIPWEDDPQREHPNLRQHFSELYYSLIASTGVGYTHISGTSEQRIQRAVEAVEYLVSR